MSRKKTNGSSYVWCRWVHIVYGPAGSDMSGNEPDKSELAVRKLLNKLQQLADRDPNNKFGTYFVRLQLKLLKRLRNSRH